MVMKRSVSLVSIAFLMLTGAAVYAEEATPPPATVVAPAAPIVTPKPSAPAAAPVAVPKPIPAAKEKQTTVPLPASPAGGAPESTHAGGIPPAAEAKTATEPAIAPGDVTGYVWPAFSFAMLIVGFAAGYFWRHHVSRHKLGGMTVRIGTWRGTP